MGSWSFAFFGCKGYLVAVLELNVKLVLEDDQVTLALLVLHLGLQGLGNGVQEGASLDGILFGEETEPEREGNRK